MKKSLIFLVACVPLVLAIMGGGNQEAYGRPSYVVAIRTNFDDSQGKHLCGGALFGERFVITAATCVKGKRPQDLYIVSNMTDLSDTWREVLHIDGIINKDSTGQDEVNNNIALLHLESYYKPTQLMHPIGIVDRVEDEEKEGDSCIFYGWGQIDVSQVSAKLLIPTYGKIERPDDESRLLQRADTKIASLDACRKYNKDVDKSNICTYNPDARLCNLDTGDPLESAGVLWGIATKQSTCLASAGRSSGDVYTRVHSHKDWIIENTQSASTHHKSKITKICIFALVIISFNQ